MKKMFHNFSLKGGSVIALLLLAIPVHADQWTFFYPESVTRFWCNAERVTMGTGMRPQVDEQEYWIAMAHAERTQQGAWGAEIGRFPGTNKGLRQATKACVDWAIEAEKRIRRAKP